MSKVKVAVAGVGNCASALIQGTRFYSNAGSEDPIGLTGYSLGGIEPADIEFVAAFDVDAGKVGRDLSEAIFQPQNNLPKISDVPRMGVEVLKGDLHDGVGEHLNKVVTISNSGTANVRDSLRDSGADVLINYLPVGSRIATRAYAEAALDAGVAFVNAMPVFIASDQSWSSRFTEKKLPVAGDDVMSQFGATVLHKSIIKLCVDRGVKVDETYQLNIGGDTDFLNMLDEERLEDKRVSKTSAVKAMAPYDIPTRIGPSDYVQFLQNDKVCYIWLKGRYFGNMPVTLDIKLRVIDSYNSAGVMIDAIRGVKVALTRGVSGPLTSLSAYCFKHPPIQMTYNDAKQSFLEFIEGRRER